MINVNHPSPPTPLSALMQDLGDIGLRRIAVVVRCFPRLAEAISRRGELTLRELGYVATNTRRSSKSRPAHDVAAKPPPKKHRKHS